jgi:hypothetical protein
MQSNQNSTEQPPRMVQVGERVCIYERRSVWYVYYRHEGRVYRRSLRTSSKKEARQRALAIERDLVTGQLAQPAKPPLIKEVVQTYLDHLRALGRSRKTLAKYEHCFLLVLQLADELGVTRINQLDLRFVDVFRRRRTERSLIYEPSK